MRFEFSQRPYTDIADRRAAYLRTLMAPLDGMWENGFLPMADHWEISHQNRPVGFCAINADRKMLSFDVPDAALQRAAFRACLAHLQASGAFVSTTEPAYLALCADHQSSMAVNALMYTAMDAAPTPPQTPAGMTVRAALPDDLDTAIGFGVAAIQADRDWLTSYFQERIAKHELFGLWQGHALVATGECRISPNQQAVADVGMIVGQPYRKQGLATYMLRHLTSIAAQQELTVICSTESGNIAAQKAIERAGFVARHRLLDFEF
jgi:GNAT superfamily N-acetyltransferase